MNRYCRLLYAASIFLTLTTLASAQPQPLTIQGSRADGTPAFIRGFEFGPSPADAVAAQVSGTLDGLRSCVVLADGPTPGQDVRFEVQELFYWRDDVVAFSLGRTWPVGTNCLFLFLIDDHGVPSAPIGPLVVVEGSPRLEGVESALEVVAEKAGDGETVSLLRPESGGSLAGCYRSDAAAAYERPGQPGVPQMVNWNP